MAIAFRKQDLRDTAAEAGGDQIELRREIKQIPAEGTVNSENTEAVIEK